MKITDIKVRRTFRTGNILAIVSITIDNCFAVHDIKIIDNGIRRFAAMPSRSDDEGGFCNIAHPIGAECREKIEKLILDEYDRYMKLTKFYERLNVKVS